MAAPVGVDRERVVEAAVALLERRGTPDAVTLGDVAAEVGIRTQSLYAHVDGLDGLRRELALRGLGRLAGALTDAAIGRAGRDALGAIVRAWVRFAATNPGLYAASLRAPGDDADLRAAVAAATRPLEIVLRSYGLTRTAVTHWQRIIFSTVHGFATLRAGGLLTMPAAPDETVRRFVAVIADQLDAEGGGR